MHFTFRDTLDVFSPVTPIRMLLSLGIKSNESMICILGAINPSYLQYLTYISCTGEGHTKLAGAGMVTAFRELALLLGLLTVLEVSAQELYCPSQSPRGVKLQPCKQKHKPYASPFSSLWLGYKKNRKLFLVLHVV